jgi:phage repressor protein C with HTH and peptisase S24 domain
MISHSASMHYAQVPRKCLLHNSLRYAACMKSAGDRLKQARLKAGYSSAALAATAMGVSPATYAQHENGLRGFPAARAEKYARFFRVTPEWLLYGKDKSDTVVALGPRLFVIGEVAGGVFREAWKVPADEWEAFTGRADIAAPVQKRFGLRVSGDSMNALYPEGTILDCVEYDGQEIIPSGKRVIVQRTRIDGHVEATVKELIRDEDGVEWLVPRSHNPIHRAFRGDQPDSKDISRVEIIGVVVASIREE